MLPLIDLVPVVGIALMSSLLVGAVGLVVLRLARRASLMVQLVVIVVATILAVVVGIVAVAQAMYISSHDLLVLFWLAGASAIGSLGVALLLGRTLTRNSRLLRSMTRDLGDGKRVDAVAGSAGSAEFASLAADLSLTSQKLAEAREEVAALDASRRELVAWISHDLRTPLASLRAMAEALEDGMTDDPQRFHRQMRVQVDHLSAMVDDLFDLSKIHSGTLKLAMEPVSLYDLVSDAVAELGALAESRSVTLKELGSGEPTVVGDPRELARVIGNLLINAIQHSPAGS
jgi:signal transduction histidine kinase